MAIQIRGTGHSNTKIASGTTMTWPLDAGILGGELGVYAFCQNNTGPTFTPPAGWTLVGAQQIATGTSANTKGAVYAKILTAAEAGTSPTFTTSSASAAHGGGGAFYDDAGGFLSATADQTPTPTTTAVDSTTITTPTLTPTVERSLLIVVGSVGEAVAGDATFTPPAGMTEAYDAGPAGLAGASTMAWVEAVGIGAISAKTITCSLTWDSAVGFMFNFKVTAADPFHIPRGIGRGITKGLVG